jgi:tRNA (pseudouridine54-N1)-methyltransferase
MRRFVVRAHAASVEEPIALDDLPGSGRIDVLARCVTSGLLLSHGIREDTRVELVVDDYTIRFAGASARSLHPDERSTAARIRDALDAHEEAIGHQPVEVSPGVDLVRKDFAATLGDAATDGELLTLSVDGESIATWDPPGDVTFVLSDHRSFTDDERATLEDVADRTLGLGPNAIHAADAIAVAHNHLDTAGEP